jgi:hypothetical protein
MGCNKVHTSSIATYYYASPAWFGFIRAAKLVRLHAIVDKTVRHGFLPTSFPSLPELFHSADQSLFKLVTLNARHVLYHLLPPVKITGYNVQSQSLQFILPILSTSLSKKEFHL